MKRELQGNYVQSSTAGETVNAFTPAPLPPNPPIEWTPLLFNKFQEAHLALGRLDGVSSNVPNKDLFLYMYVRKEAVLSSKIEGTQSSLSDLLLYEFEQEPGAPLDDVQEVSSYVAALEYGLRRINEDFPMSLRLIKEVHFILLAKGRGGHATPGEFRHSQNWIGGTRPGNATYVPPPPTKVLDCMGELEKFLNDIPHPTPPLLKAALAHAQFETIHPFLDGNGRLGRLLITLILCEQKIIKEPLLYLSLYFKKHRPRYYDLLNSARADGDWETWLTFFAEAVIATASHGADSIQKLAKMVSEDRQAIVALGRTAGSALKIHEAMLERPLSNVTWLAKKTGLTWGAVNATVLHLEKLGILKRVNENRRNRLFAYSQYLEILNAEDVFLETASDANEAATTNNLSPRD
ncbi:MAG: Fic family protein [Deltaproteobacteria bacterium]|jgi:Fic family protein|nr:Fic family protein [Deltaproteobacteria bacterium]